MYIYIYVLSFYTIIITPISSLFLLKILSIFISQPKIHPTKLHRQTTEMSSLTRRGIQTTSQTPKRRNLCSILTDFTTTVVPCHSAKWTTLFKVFASSFFKTNLKSTAPKKMAKSEWVTGVKTLPYL